MNARILPLFGIIIVFLVEPAVAVEPWDAITHTCDEWAEANICVSKAGCPSWQWLARCTVTNYYQDVAAISRLEWCIRNIEGNRARSHTPAMTGNPVDDAMRCITAGR